jgi:hypothetical protein
MCAGQEVQAAAGRMVAPYKPVWSLADKRSTGTLMLIHYDLIPGDDKKGGS